MVNSHLLYQLSYSGTESRENLAAQGLTGKPSQAVGLAEHFQSHAQKLEFEQAVVRYIRHQVAEGRRRHSYLYIERFWSQTFEGRWLADVRSEEAEHALDAYVQEHRLKPASRNNCLGQLRGLYNYYARRGKVLDNPCRDIPKWKVNNARTRWVRPDEYEAILEHCEPWLADMVSFSIRTGLRLGETLSLTAGSYSVDAYV